MQGDDRGESWLPLDFLLRGRHCTPDEARAFLDSIRRAAGLSALAAVPVDQDRVLGELTLVVAEDTATESAVLTAINAGLDTPAKTTLRKRLQRIALGPSCPPDAAVEPLSHSVPEFSDLSVVPAPFAGRRAMVHPVLLTPDRQAQPVSSEDSDMLVAMINGTAEIRNHTDERVMDLIDRSFVMVDPSGDVRLDALAVEVRALALSATASDYAFVHWSGAGSDNFRTLEQLGQVHELVDDGQHHRLEALREVMADGRSLQREVAGGTVHVCPIPLALGVPQAPAGGALLVERSTRRDFSAYDLALIRNLCLRFALMAAQRASLELAEIVREVEQVPHGELAAAAEAPTAPLATDLPFTRDQLSVIEDLHSLLPRVAEATGSRSAKVSLLVTSADSRSEAGRTLEIAHQHGPGPLGSSTEWAALREGRIWHVPDLSREEGDIDGQSGSRVSTSIRAHGQPVGVLTLENEVVGHYGHLLSQVAAIGGALGRRLADAADALSHPHMDHYREIMEHAHVMDRELKILDEIADELQSGADTGLVDVDRIKDFISRSRHLIDGSARHPPTRASTRNRRYLDDVVGEQVARYTGAIDVDVAPAPTHVEIGGDAAADLALTLDAVFSNISEHRGPTASAPRRPTRRSHLHWEVERWDGHRQAVLTFCNDSTSPMTPTETREVYRVPLHRDGRLRLGAYLAALRLRQIGGTVTFSMTRESRAHTTIAVPIP